MEISGIDEDFVDIIEYLNSKGLCPFASCDGVLAHHENKEKPTNAYIALLKSNRIIDVMSALLRDKSNFSVSFPNSIIYCKYFSQTEGALREQRKCDYPPLGERTAFSHRLN